MTYRYLYTVIIVYLFGDVHVVYKKSSVCPNGLLLLSPTGDGEKSFTHPLSKQSLLLDLDRDTNSRRLGVFVYRVDQTEIIEPATGEGREIGREKAERVQGGGHLCGRSVNIYSTCIIQI